MDLRTPSNSARGTANAHGGDDRGASLVEYALLIGLIAVVCAVAVTFFGVETGDSFSRATSSIFVQ